MKLTFAEQPRQDNLHWQKSEKQLLKRTNTLVTATQPGPLKHALSGYWSRRINDEHRVVYKIQPDALLVAQLRYHY